MKKLLIILVGISFSIITLFSQTKTIKGRVISEYLEILPVVSILINDTIEVCKTDANGFFQFNIPKAEKKIRFRLLGMEPTVIVLKEKCDNIEVVMMVDYIYDFISLKRVDRIRRKRYMNLPKVHKQAFEKSIFKTECACFYQEFDPLAERSE